MWWGHNRHRDVKDEIVEAIFKRVNEDGMGPISLHYSHSALLRVQAIARDRFGMADAPRLVTNPAGGADTRLPTAIRTRG